MSYIRLSTVSGISDIEMTAVILGEIFPPAAVIFVCIDGFEKVCGNQLQSSRNSAIIIRVN